MELEWEGAERRLIFWHLPIITCVNTYTLCHSSIVFPQASQLFHKTYIISWSVFTVITYLYVAWHMYNFFSHFQKTRNKICSKEFFSIITFVFNIVVFICLWMPKYFFILFIFLWIVFHKLDPFTETVCSMNLLVINLFLSHCAYFSIFLKFFWMFAINILLFQLGSSSRHNGKRFSIQILLIKFRWNTHKITIL